jgi:hypothetical protein
MSYVTSESEKRAFSELPLFVRPLTISPKAITKGITSGRRFLKWQEMKVKLILELKPSATSEVDSPPRSRARANGNG